MTKELMRDKELEIIHLYTEKRMSLSDIGKLFNCKAQRIHGVLIKNNVERRPLNKSHTRVSKNEKFFSEINTQEKAYILGFLYADGCNYSKRNRTLLTLQENDKEILNKIKECIEYTGDLIYVCKNPPHQNQWTLSLSSKEISEDLNKLGCVPRKSLILTFPTEEQVPSHLIHHFIRGYFDGDGCLSMNKNTQSYNLSFVGTFEFLSGVLNTLHQDIGISLKKICKINHKQDRNTYLLSISGRNQLKKVLNWLYKDSTIYLDRKYTKFKQFEQYHQSFFLNQLQRKDFSKNKMCKNLDCYNVTYSNKDVCKSCHYNKKIIIDVQP